MNEYDAVILGAGPSGLAAAYSLADKGLRVVVVESAPHVGGLMRGVQRGDFSLDLGRKELYSRFHEVHSLWTEILGNDYRPYPRRLGILYDNRIIEKESLYKGRSRNMSFAQRGGMATSLLWSQVKFGSRHVQNLEDYYLLRYGRKYYDTFIYGFLKKFGGHDLNQLPVPGGIKSVPRFSLFRNRFSQTNSHNELPNGQQGWYHPARGTQQIADAIWQKAQSAGITFIFNAKATTLNLKDGKICSVVIQKEDGVSTLGTRYAIASMRIPALLNMLSPAPPQALQNPPKKEIAFKKSTALVYLMANHEPLFPHNWLEVTDMKLRVGRIVNYATWQGNMVPAGKTALCMEYFTIEGDGLMDFSKDALLKLAISEAVQNGLIDESKIFDHLVIQLPTVNAATVFTDWHNQWMKQALNYLHNIEGLIEINRPGIDRATLAGIDAATACLTNKPMSTRSMEETPGWG